MRSIPDKSIESLSLFCRVVDNFGDIGVCWRLSRALAAHHAGRVRLWLDDFSALRRIVPAFPDGNGVLHFEGVEVHPWQEPFDAIAEDAVVIEAFACELPDSAVAAMVRRSSPPLWINLEYLSAEDWVADCHGMRSPHPRLPLVKHFFFPGFDTATGGLLREPDLFARRDALQSHREARLAVFRQRTGRNVADDALVVSLFAYEQPGLPGLLAAWARSARPVLVLAPEGRVVPDLARHFGRSSLETGACHTDGALTVCVIPFTAQDEYDALLWACDLNFVRGEDSFVRAQWAALPFVWHIYRQEDDAHLLKLDAFLQRFLPGLETTQMEAVRGFWRAWNGVGDVAACWPAFAEALPDLKAHGRAWAERLGRQDDLASALAKFLERCV